MYQPTGNTRTSDQRRVKLRVTDKIDDLQLIIYIRKKKKKCLNIRSQRTGTGAFIAVYLLCCSEEAAPAQPAAHHHEGDSSLYISASLAEVVICPRSAASHFPCMHAEKSLIKKKVQIVCFGYQALIFNFFFCSAPRPRQALYEFSSGGLQRGNTWFTASASCAGHVSPGRWTKAQMLI